MSTNLVLMKENEELLELSKKLGFSKTLFLGKDLALVSGINKKKILNEIKEAKKKNLFVVVKAVTEEVLRFVLEKTTADLVFGQEMINPKDSVHFRRGGLDQILCKIARDKGKIIGFSFQDILNSNEKAKVMGRMMLNIKLCRKYKVKTFFGNLSENLFNLRSKKDLEAFWNVLGGKGLIIRI